MPPQIGAVIAERYRLESVLGKGGMGVVFAAHDLKLDRRVAAKVIHQRYQTCCVSLARFEREAHVAQRMRGKYFVRVYGFGRLPDGGRYLIMEHLTGCTLASVIASQGALELTRASGFVLRACEAVAEAHHRAVVHRDIKPQNLFLANGSADRQVLKVLDFGVAKLLSGEDLTEVPPLTDTGEAVGTPMYMSPEQLRSAREVDGRTDIWSLGVTLFELLCGRTPFEGRTAAELHLAVLVGPIPNVCDIAPELPSSVGQIIARCLQRDPNHRYRAITGLARDLAPFAGGGSSSVLRRIESWR